MRCDWDVCTYVQMPGCGCSRTEFLFKPCHVSLARWILNTFYLLSASIWVYIRSLNSGNMRGPSAMRLHKFKHTISFQVRKMPSSTLSVKRMSCFFCNTLCFVSLRRRRRYIFISLSFSPLIIFTLDKVSTNMSKRSEIHVAKTHTRMRKIGSLKLHKWGRSLCRSGPRAECLMFVEIDTTNSCATILQS